MSEPQKFSQRYRDTLLRPTKAELDYAFAWSAKNRLSHDPRDIYHFALSERCCRLGLPIPQLVL